MANKNWAAWYENEPKYKAGDVVLYSSGLSYNGEVVIIESVKSEKTKYIKETEERIANQRLCCGRKEGRGVRVELNYVEYKLSNGKTCPEHEIYGGIDKINEAFADLRKQVEYAEERIQDVKKALDLSDY